MWNDELAEQIICCQRKVLSTMDVIQQTWLLQRATDDAKKEENLTALEIPGLQRGGVAIAHIEG